jgi:hypothetical protein
MDSYFDRGVTLDDLAAFFTATRALFRAHPWDELPPERCALRVTAPAAGIGRGIVTVTGDMGENCGFLLFASENASEAFAEQSATAALGVDPEFIPPHLSLSFVFLDELSPRQQAEVALHHWPVAGGRGYPRVLASHDFDNLRGPERDELRRIIAVTEALVQLVETEPALAQAPEVVSRTFRVTSGEVTLTLELPDDGEDVRQLVYAPLHDRYVEELSARFAASEEAAALGDDAHWASPLIGYAASDIGRPVAQLDRTDLEHLLLDLVPRKVVASPDDASDILAATKALLRFVARTAGQSADEELLDFLDRAEPALKSALADDRLFGMAKSWFVQGKNAGFDLETEEGLEAWKVVSSERATREHTRNAVDKKREKAKKKAQRKARKKNRR